MPSFVLEGRRILVTGGPTWVRIDAVRHLGNVSSGRTGLVIAREAAARGAEVTLLLGPGRACPTDEDRRRLDVVDFETFDDLHHLLLERLRAHRYDALIHSAAVSDYRPVVEETGKLSSDAEELVIRLRRTPKIVDEVKRLDPEILLVKFKLQVGKNESELLEIARQSQQRSSADLIVANDLQSITATRHRAYLVDGDDVLACTETTAQLAERLMSEIETRLKGRSPRQPSGA
jgi:phosphopantothenoylcysteine decarboxylase / phosphopantothenate---cysteine ligase